MTSLIKDKEKEISKKIIKEIREATKKYNDKDIKRYNYLQPHLIFKTSFVYIKTISSNL